MIFKYHQWSEYNGHQRIYKFVRPHTISNKNYSKNFGIGNDKTGTTTLEQTLRIYGLNLPIQQEQEVTLVKQFFEGNYDTLKSFVEKYDAFQDLPFSMKQSYVICDALFPNSKFILTIRNPEIWFESVCNFNAKHFFGINDISKLTEEDVKRKFKLYDGYVYENVKKTPYHCKQWKYSSEV